MCSVFAIDTECSVCVCLKRVHICVCVSEKERLDAEVRMCYRVRKTEKDNTKGEKIFMLTKM